MNKLFGLFLLALAFLAPSAAQAVGCFWVGGTGSINDTTHWSNASGGSGSTCGAAGGWPNSASDDGTFNASSGGGTITRNVNWTTRFLDVAAFTGTFGNAGDTATVTTLGFTNNGSGTRTVNLGASTWTISTAGSWTQTGATNLTFNANTSTIVFSGSTSATNQVANFGTFTYNVVTFNAESAQSNKGTTWNASATIPTLNIAAPNTFLMSNATNNSITTFNVTGGSLSAFVSFLSIAGGNQFTYTFAGAAACSFCIFRDMIAATSAITATNSITLGNNTNISVTPPSAGGGGGGRIIGG